MVEIPPFGRRDRPPASGTPTRSPGHHQPPCIASRLMHRPVAARRWCHALDELRPGDSLRHIPGAPRGETRRREEQGGRNADAGADDRRARRARRVNHGSDVVHPRLQPRSAVHTIRHPNATLVKDDHSREPREGNDDAARYVGISVISSTCETTRGDRRHRRDRHQARDRRSRRHRYGRNESPAAPT